MFLSFIFRCVMVLNLLIVLFSFSSLAFFLFPNIIFILRLGFRYLFGVSLSSVSFD